MHPELIAHQVTSFSPLSQLLTATKSCFGSRRNAPMALAALKLRTATHLPGLASVWPETFERSCTGSSLRRITTWSTWWRTSRTRAPLRGQGAPGCARYGIRPNFKNYPHSNLLPEFFTDILDVLHMEGMPRFIVEVGSLHGHSAIQMATVLDRLNMTQARSVLSH